MDDENSLLIEVKELIPETTDPDNATEQCTAEPDVNELRKNLREIYQNHDLYRRIRSNGLETAKKYTWFDQAERIRNRCDALVIGFDYPLWRIETKLSTLAKPKTEENLEVVIFSSSNTYILSRTLDFWNKASVRPVLSLVDFVDDPLDTAFISFLTSNGFIDSLITLGSLETWNSGVKKLLSNTDSPYVHFSAFDRHPNDINILNTLKSRFEKVDAVAGIGGHVISPYRTMVHGPFKHNSVEIENSLVNKSVSSKLIQTRLKTQRDTSYIHFQTGYFKRQSLLNINWPSSHVGTTEFSIEICNALREQRKILECWDRLYIESEEFPGSIFTKD